MTSAEPTARPRPTGSAKAVLLTVLGELVLPSGGEVWTGTLVDGLEALGYGDRNSRQAIARLRDDGVIIPRRHGRKTRWHLSSDGERLLQVGADRIYRFGRHIEPWDGRWLVVLCSVPESQREKRRRFRTRLSFAGFGFVSPTVAVSPHLAAEGAATEIIEELDLTDLAVVLRASTGEVTADGELLSRSWDLEALGESYREFVAELIDVHPEGQRASFVELVRLVHAWRQFPFSDPELPPELLPPGWAGNTARHLFHDARSAWTTDAVAFFKSLEAEHDQ